MRKTAKFTAKYLDKLIEEATTDAYNVSEQAGGFFAMIEENLALPFVTPLSFPFSPSIIATPSSKAPHQPDAGPRHRFCHAGP